MSALIESHDWSTTPLGAIDTWPASLRTTVSLCLASNFPINILWGPDAIQIYNIGYREVCGAAHPRAVGESYRVTWASAWPAIGAPFEAARRGETSFLENQRMFLERNGYLEETFFTFSLSPIRNDLGEVAGLFHPVTETTATMLSERRTRALRDLAIEAGSIESVESASRHILSALASYKNDAPFVILYRFDASSDEMHLLGAVGLDASVQAPDGGAPTDAALWPLREAINTSAAMLVEDVRQRAGAIACADYPEATAKAFIVPIRTAVAGAPFGFAVIGLSTRLPLNDAYQGFVELLGEAMSATISMAVAYESEKRRADELAALDTAKTAFFSNVSHEFRTPLTLMLGPLEDALSDTVEPLGPIQRERQELLQRNALRLLKLVNTLLEFSRIQSGRVDAIYRPTDLPRLTTDLASVFRAALERAGLAFRVEIEALGEPVFVDHDMWEKIVLNLLSNAFKFTAQGEILVKLDRYQGRARLRVQDTGTGIAAEELPKVFQRFHRVEGAGGRSHEGSGIGLALVHELVKLHGGEIHVDSQAGAGSTFEILLPFSSAHLPADRVRAAAGPGDYSRMRSAFENEATSWVQNDVTQPPMLAPNLEFLTGMAPLEPGPGDAGRRRIMVVEDNADMRAYLTGLLDELGEVEAVHNGHAALAALALNTPDLIISDVMMPGLGGLELLERLRSNPETVEIPLVLLSAKAGEESRLEGLRLGADDYLVKPFSARELLARATTQLKLGDARRIARSERNRLFEFFVQSPLPMAILSGPDHRFVIANEPYARLVGRDVVNKTVAQAFPPEDVEAFIPMLDKVLSTGHPFNGRGMPFRARDSNGVFQESFIDVSYQPFRETTGEVTGVLAIVVDVTEQVLARVAIEETISQLTDERALRERFVLTLAHDLRNPIQVVQMGAALIRHHVSDREALLQTAKRIDRNAALADSMICDLLDANRLKAGGKMPLSIQPCDLSEVVSSTLLGLSERHGERFSMFSELERTLGQWDGAAIRRVIENLAGNAVKYGKRDAPITLRLVRAESFVELAVHNEGDAIQARDQSAIFDPFYRTQAATDGLQTGWGVGLTLVRGIAEAHGGTASVESDAVKGTTFFVRLPI